LIAGLALANSACGLGLILHVFKLDDSLQVRYNPTLRLDESPLTIEARAQLAPFLNKMPAPATDSSWSHYEVTSPQLMEGDLAELVRQAILTDFRANLVFRSIRKNEAQPDVIVSGVLYRFEEHYNRPWYTVIPLVRFFGVTVGRFEGGVDLELIVTTPTGRLIDAYHGRSTFSEALTQYAGAAKTTRRPGDRLNRAFTEAIRQVRAQMTADQRVVSTDWSAAEPRVPGSPAPPTP
jgi:hypothetical protein